MRYPGDLATYFVIGRKDRCYLPAEVVSYIHLLLLHESSNRTIPSNLLQRFALEVIRNLHHTSFTKGL